MMKFRLAGIKFYVSFPAISLICLSLFISDDKLCLLPVCLLASVIHEAGHLIFVCRYKGKPESICIKTGEVAINCNLCFATYKEDLIITIAGICVNIIVSSVCFLLYQIIPSAFVFNVAMCNLVVGLFNLLPIKTFDGGQLTELLLTRRFSTSTVEKLVNIITITTVIPIAFAGAYILLTSKFNYSMLLLAIYWLLLIINKEMR